jgi:hypothetical protein
MNYQKKPFIQKRKCHTCNHQVFAFCNRRILEFGKLYTVFLVILFFQILISQDALSAQITFKYGAQTDNFWFKVEANDEVVVDKDLIPRNPVDIDNSQGGVKLEVFIRDDNGQIGSVHQSMFIPASCPNPCKKTVYLEFPDFLKGTKSFEELGRDKISVSKLSTAADDCGRVSSTISEKSLSKAFNTCKIGHRFWKRGLKKKQFAVGWYASTKGLHDRDKELYLQDEDAKQLVRSIYKQDRNNRDFVASIGNMVLVQLDEEFAPNLQTRQANVQSFRIFRVNWVTSNGLRVNRKIRLKKSNFKN